MEETTFPAREIAAIAKHRANPSFFQPCPKGLAWLRQQTSLQQAWADCPDGGWMLWYIFTIIQPAKHTPLWQQAVLATCAVARTTLKFIPKGESRPLLEAIIAAENYATDTTKNKLTTAIWAAAAAAAATTDAFAFAAAAAATYTAYAAACTNTFTTAALCAAAVTDATNACADALAAERNANIVRQFIPSVPRGNKNE